MIPNFRIGNVKPHMSSPHRIIKEGDAECEVHTAININLVVPWLLMASYAYYIEDDPFISDAMYDQLSKAMAANYAMIEHHHKVLIPPPEGAVVHLHTLAVWDYPLRVVGGLNHVRKHLKFLIDTDPEPCEGSPHDLREHQSSEAGGE